MVLISNSKKIFLKKHNTLFSPKWSRAEVLETLFEACRNFPIKGTKYLEKGNVIIESVTNNGMTIKMILKNNMLRSFYPILK